MRSTLTLCALMLIAAEAGCAVIELPSLSINSSTVDARVTYDTARAVYRYEYTVHAAATNQAAIKTFMVDISGGRMNRPQIDPDLLNNVVRDEATGIPVQSPTTIPVGIIVPNASRYDGGVGKPGWAYFSSIKGAGDVAAGQNVGGFVLESKFPPAVRNAFIEPSQASWTPIMRAAPADSEFYPTTADVYEVKTTAVGPSDPDPAALYNGGGQSPAEVNPFLRYASPTDNRLHLPVGTSAYDVIVFYGSTTNPQSMSATLNGADVRSLFTPIPGAAQLVHINLVAGTNKLQLSIEGTTSSGRVAKDTDTLTFLIP